MRSAWILLVGLMMVARGEERLPHLFIVGDSTVHNTTKGYAGWAGFFIQRIDPTRMVALDCAVGGTSSRSFLRDGSWEPVKSRLQPGDFVLIQFGHNDDGGVKDGNDMASLDGIGEATKEVMGPRGNETVRTYGAYLSVFITDTLARKATPIVCSPVPQNRWRDGKVERVKDTYVRWGRKTAEVHGVPFVDLNGIAAWHYESVGREKVFSYFKPVDAVHTTPAGAKAHAACVVAGLRQLPDQPFAPFLKPSRDRR